MEPFIINGKEKGLGGADQELSAATVYLRYLLFDHVG